MMNAPEILSNYKTGRIAFVIPIQQTIIWTLIVSYLLIYKFFTIVIPSFTVYTAEALNFSLEMFACFTVAFFS